MSNVFWLNLGENRLLFYTECNTQCFISNESKEKCTCGHREFLHVHLQDGDYCTLPPMFFIVDITMWWVKKPFSPRNCSVHWRSLKNMGLCLTHHSLILIGSSVYTSVPAAWGPQCSTICYIVGKVPASDDILRQSYVNIHQSCNHTKSTNNISSVQLLMRLLRICIPLFWWTPFVICKSEGGDGFQDWHQDLVNNAQTDITVVVNVGNSA